MNDSLIECFGKFPKLAAHLHLPIQSGSDRILSAMKRNYTSLEYKNIIRKLKKNCKTMKLIKITQYLSHKKESLNMEDHLLRNELKCKK